MRKTLIYITVLFISVYWFLTFTMTSLKAGEYSTAVLGHVITQKITGRSIDTSYLLEQELKRAAHSFAIENLNILQKHLPSILDGAAAELRHQSDNSYKCSLIKDTSIKCK